MMGSGAALGLLRGFVVAALLSSPGFGVYATIVAIAVFASPILGFGHIEAARKRFPRMYVEHRFDEIRATTDGVAWHLLWRNLALSLAVSLLLFVIGQQELAWYALVAGAISCGSAWASLLASALRAGDNLTPFGWATVMRSALSLMIVGAGAAKFGFWGAVVGEAMAALGAPIIMRWMLRYSLPQSQRAVPDAPDQAPRLSKVSLEGTAVFLGGMAVAVPLYLSRPIGAVLFSAQDLGTFAFLMLFATASTTAIGIIDQWAGPELVRKRHKGAEAEHLRRYLFTISAGLGVLLALGLACAFIVIQLPYFTPLFGKYDLSVALLLPLTLFCLLHLASTNDWMLQAHDREAGVLRAGVIYMAAFIVGTIGLIWIEGDLLDFLWVLVVAKFFQYATQVAFIARLR